MRIIYFLFLCFILLISPVVLKAQISTAGAPTYFSQLKSSESIPIKSFKYVPNVREKSIATDHAGKGDNITFAHAFNVNYTPENCGAWSVSGNMKIWRLAISSPGAYTINLIFDRYVLPKGAKLYLFNPSGSDIKGAFTNANNKESGILATAPVMGDTIIIEYQEPLNPEFNGELLIGAVNHDFVGIEKYDEKVGYFGDSGLCNIDVSCNENVGINEIQRSVLRMIVNGTEYCTATLINNMLEDGKPYVITAAHCFSTVPYLGETATFYFNYEVPHCSGDIEGSPSMVVQEQSLSGANMKCMDVSMDYALLELSETPPDNYRPYYAGWNLSNSPSSTFASIHHPMGDVKKISTFDGSLVTSTFNVSEITVKSGHWKVSQWSTGTTERGSSGAAIFDGDHLIVGTLSGGDASCGNSVNDYFAKLNLDWDAAASAEDQIKTYLDPENSGSQACLGYDPYGDYSYQRISNIEDGEVPTKGTLDGDGGYMAGHNTNQISQYAEMFGGMVSATVKGVYIMPSAYTAASTQIVKIILYTGNSEPANEIASIEKRIGNLGADKEIYVEFDQELPVTGNIFVAYQIEYPGSGYDDFAVYHSGVEFAKSNNSMMLFDGASWVLASDYYGIDNTSLWIDLLARNVVRGDTSIHTPEDEIISVGPNPLKSNIIYVSSKKNIDRYELFNVSGDKISSALVNESGSSTPIVLPELTNGVYLLKLFIEDKSKVFKIVKN